MALLAAPAFGADKPAVVISGVGEGRWAMKCEVLNDGGVKMVLLDRAIPTYNDPKLRRASCDYKVNAKTALTIAVSGAESCPFPIVPDGAACSLVAAPGARGTFKVPISKGR
ncbi:hypothetical protein [Phenylobacterium immobile]|uniref:hypothetical protein n=1 Tax=Phenylobacterium immobile TaxID=21 RepID=UPI00159EBBE6|nr:hypothetical protein [Phenylobacterium immobile]